MARRKLNRGLRSPSKFLSLKYLQDLQDNDYCNKDSGIDYVPDEVDQLIFDKLARKDQHDFTRRERDMHEFMIYDLKVRRVKPCSKCGDELPFEMFHAASCKKTFGLRSHCKKCRSKKIPF